MRSKFPVEEEYKKTSTVIPCCRVVGGIEKGVLPLRYRALFSRPYPLPSKSSFLAGKISHNPVICVLLCRLLHVDLLWSNYRHYRSDTRFMNGNRFIHFTESLTSLSHPIFYVTQLLTSLAELEMSPKYRSDRSERKPDVLCHHFIPSTFTHVLKRMGLNTDL